MPKTATYQKALCRRMYDRYCGWLCSSVGRSDYFLTFFSTVDYLHWAWSTLILAIDFACFADST